MKTILSEFIASMENIENNFYLSFLAVNFINQKPFSIGVVLGGFLKNKVITAQSLNLFDSKAVQEYGNSIRRHTLNDIVIAYEGYSTTMIVSQKNKGSRTDPCHIKDISKPAEFEKIKGIYSNDDIKFFEQLRALRNSIVHYNGVYNKMNTLDYSFGTETYFSKDREGESISIAFDNIIWIYKKLINIVQAGNNNYFLIYV